MSTAYEIRSGLQGMAGREAAFAAAARSTLAGVTLRQAYGAIVARGAARGSLESVGEVRALLAVAADVELQACGPTDRRSGSGRLSARDINAWASWAALIVRLSLSPEAS